MLSKVNIRAVEFYSGIGGWSHALWQLQKHDKEMSRFQFSVVAAFDINPIANEVYQHNCCLYAPSELPTSTSSKRRRRESKAAAQQEVGDSVQVSAVPCGRPSKMERSIDQLTSAELDSLSAELWVMSPPCQPHTRNNKSDRRDIEDPRSHSFLHLLSCLTEMRSPPTYIALENVIGFEELKDTLRNRGYSFLQFDLTPSQFGVPNERPRYYCLATLQGHLSSGESSNEVLKSIPGIPVLEEEKLSLQSVLSSALSREQMQELVVPLSVLQKSAAWCFDVRDPQDFTSACFTKAYGKFVRGTGSILLVDRPADFYSLPYIEDGPSVPEASKPSASVGDGDFDSLWFKKLMSSSASEPKVLRYFSPDELLTLFGYETPHFHFPSSIKISNRKKFELIGNSLNVYVVKKLLKYLLIPT